MLDTGIDVSSGGHIFYIFSIMHGICCFLNKRGCFHFPLNEYYSYKHKKSNSTYCIYIKSFLSLKLCGLGLPDNYSSRSFHSYNNVYVVSLTNLCIGYIPRFNWTSQV